MEPAVDRLARRGWRRGSATALVLGVVLAFTVVFLAAAGSIVVGQAGDLIDRAPRYVRDFERFVNDDLGIEFDADSLVRDLRSGNGGAQRRQRRDRVERRRRRARRRTRSPLLRHGPDLRVLHDGRRPAHATRHLFAPSTRAPAGRARHVGDRHRQDRRVPVLTGHPGGRIGHRHVGVPVRPRGAVFAGAGSLGRHRLAVHPDGRHVHRHGLAGARSVQGESGEGAVRAGVPRPVPAVRELHPRTQGHQALDERAPGARDRNGVRGRAAARRRSVRSSRSPRPR